MSLNSKTLACGRFKLSLERPLIMGILNVTPDSFSDGGQFSRFDTAIVHAQRLVEEGADILDIGGESTRPGALLVSEDEELQRVIPLIEKLSSEINIPISIDTNKATVMYEAVQAGASMINDVYALQQPNALKVAASLNVPVCLMHMRGTPVTMQKQIDYKNVVDEVLDFLENRVAACVEAGISKEQLILDPGFGFGKTLEHNLSLLKAIPRFVHAGYPVLAGLSRKSMLGEITAKPVEARLAGSLALAGLAADLGANILRVHDVAETRDLLSVYRAFNSAI